MTETPETTPDPERDEPEHEPDESDDSRPDPDPHTTEQPESETRAERRRPRDERYREQLRTVEAERDTLRTQVETYQRRDAELALAGQVLDPGLMLSAIPLDELLTDGTIDQAKVDEAVEQFLDAHPSQNARPNPAAPASAVTPGAERPELSGAGNAFVDAFRPPQR